MSNDTQREAFEQWYRTAILPTHDLTTPPKYTKDALEWAWQAALATLPKVTEAELVELVKAQIRASCSGHAAEALNGEKLWSVKGRTVNMTAIARAILAKFPFLGSE